MIGIYAIYRNSDDICVYVGQSKNIQSRIWMHFNGFSHIKIKQDDYYWRVIEEHNIDDKQYRLDREEYWIDKLQPVYNKHKTGRIFFSNEARKRMGEANKGKCKSVETCKKMSESHKGKHHSNETRKKISESKKGKINVVCSFKGKHHSNETRKRISESQKGKCKSVETRKRMSESKKGKHWKIVNNKRVWY